MLKVIILRIAAIISMGAGVLGLMLGAYTPNTLIGFMEFIGVLAAIIACFTLSVYLGVKAGDIDYELHHHAGVESPLLDLPKDYSDFFQSACRD